MIILPAIDLYGGKAVRLLKGDYNNMTVYSDKPELLAEGFKALGAEYLHVVDLEGAKDGTTPHLELISKIASGCGLKVEIGGGIRTMEKIEKYISVGVNKVILGTAAVTDPAMLQSAVEKYGDKIAVGADVRDGRISIRGWLESSEFTLEDFLSKMAAVGVKNVICTDISRDGAMRGANLELYKRLNAEYDLDITASGGVSDLNDIAELRKAGLYGAIVGKAYYTGAIDIKKAIEVAK